MTAFQRQLEAIGTALLLVGKLAETQVWALTLTNDDDADSPSVLNIWAAPEQWGSLATRLGLGRPIDRSTHEGNEFISYRHGTLHISLIEEENK